MDSKLNIPLYIKRYDFVCKKNKTIYAPSSIINIAKTYIPSIFSRLNIADLFFLSYIDLFSYIDVSYEDIPTFLSRQSDSMSLFLKNSFVKYELIIELVNYILFNKYSDKLFSIKGLEFFDLVINGLFDILSVLQTDIEDYSDKKFFDHVINSIATLIKINNLNWENFKDAFIEKIMFFIKLYSEILVNLYYTTGNDLNININIHDLYTFISLIHVLIEKIFLDSSLKYQYALCYLISRSFDLDSLSVDNFFTFVKDNIFFYSYETIAKQIDIQKSVLSKIEKDANSFIEQDEFVIKMILDKKLGESSDELKDILQLILNTKMDLVLNFLYFLDEKYIHKMFYQEVFDMFGKKDLLNLLVSVHRKFWDLVKKSSKENICFSILNFFQDEIKNLSDTYAGLFISNSIIKDFIMFINSILVFNDDKNIVNNLFFDFLLNNYIREYLINIFEFNKDLGYKKVWFLNIDYFSIDKYLKNEDLNKLIRNFYQFLPSEINQKISRLDYLHKSNILNLNQRNIDLLRSLVELLYDNVNKNQKYFFSSVFTIILEVAKDVFPSTFYDALLNKINEFYNELNKTNKNTVKEEDIIFTNKLKEIAKEILDFLLSEINNTFKLQNLSKNIYNDKQNFYYLSEILDMLSKFLY